LYGDDKDEGEIVKGKNKKLGAKSKIYRNIAEQMRTIRYNN
jgi:hypothetical protein